MALVRFLLLISGMVVFGIACERSGDQTLLAAFGGFLASLAVFLPGPDRKRWP